MVGEYTSTNVSFPAQPEAGRSAGTGIPPGAVDPVVALEQHEAALASLRTALTEVESSPSYLMVTDAELGPETASRYGGAARDAAELWVLLDAVASVLGAAREHLVTRGSDRADGQELRRLLEQRWYSLTLGSGPPRSWSAPALLTEIRRRFDAVRSAVADIDRLWVTILPRVEAARATLERLQDEVDELGVPEPLIGRARALADDLADRLVEDPASVNPRDGANLDLQVAEAAKQVAALRTKHDNLDDDLGATEELLASLRVLRARAEAARSEAASKVVAPEGLVRVPGPAVLDGPDGLAARLDGLFENAAAVGWARKRSLLDTWLSSARKLEAQLLRANEANRAPIAARDELRGRLQAYRAKMAATGRAEDLAMVEVADRARQLLYTAPTDLAAAEAAIVDLAARLRP
jgi:hypothetical protein